MKHFQSDIRRFFFNLMKYTSALSAALAFVFSSPHAAAYVSAPYVIDALDVHMVVSDDNSYRVTETYEVTFSERRYGIQRKLPLFRDGRLVVRDVEADGRYCTAVRNGANLTVQIGGPEKWARSQERYVLSYAYDIGGDGMEDRDELYYNLAADYDTRINKMTFTIEMPHPFDPSPINFTYSSKGSRDNSVVEWQVDGTLITGRMKKAMEPREQMTVALPLPEGYYRDVTGKVINREAPSTKLNQSILHNPFLRNLKNYIFGAMGVIILWENWQRWRRGGRFWRRRFWWSSW